VAVTGGSRGIGKVLAIRLAKEGAHIVVCARSQQSGDLPGMAAAGGGTIVNISSGAARHAPPPTRPASAEDLDTLDPSYGMTKAALDRMTTSYAAELMAHNIAIVSVSPGLVLTERIRQAAIRRNVEVARAQSPDVIATAVAIVARDGMKYAGRVLAADDLVREHNGSRGD
jgi:NAD(P)-dependent dehydrogenase (short-subunit alcohol dehydrogenase family)